ncbi:winged helix-turn-helix transcriptional regulator [Nonomuraea sediminis]|uniref:winged helix-turn-helix transcriptional regulator n=1 Tax=Nonomuraea sediminis TaxID=2835864 RepID=UPI001BDDA97A|nr:helix-turn-helix domain-containing protein [Nonomuraea sediminis]
MEEGTSQSLGRCADTDSDPFQWDAREDCEVRQILDRIADKWSLLVIALLERRVMRFTELRREIDGISQRMLTVTLRHLERDGLVRRTVHPVVPPQVDYELTPMGATLHVMIQALVDWTEDHQEQIAAARTRYDTRGVSRNEIPARNESPVSRNERVCAHCGMPFPAARTGRPARYCSPTCRQRAHRLTHRTA